MNSPAPRSSRTMRAITQRRYGGPETLECAEVDVPVAGPNEVLIRVRAASVNAADWLLMRGEPYLVRLASGVRRPRVATRGRDVAGVIEAISDGVHGFAIGHEVYAEVDAGSFAEFTVAAQGRIARMPANLTFEQAAAVPVAATTALQGLRDVAKVQPGDRVLINGASGGVGSFAVQLAKAFSAEVTGVCSTRNLALVRSLGADHAIDYSTEDFTAGDQKYDVILDLVGNRSLTEHLRALAPRGTLVLASGSGGRVLGPIPRMLAGVVRGMFVSQRLRPLAAAASAADLIVLRELIEAGQVMPSIERTYQLADAADALRHFGVQHARGKIAITVV